MTVSDFLEDARVAVENRGVRGVSAIANSAFHGGLSRAGLLRNYGDDLWARDWDLLVVIDACRVDLIESVAEEYEFIETVDRIDSPASHSHEWLRRMFLRRKPGLGPLLEGVYRLTRDPDDLDVYRELFDHRDLSGVAYITWNQFSRVLDGEAFDVFDEVWRYAWDDDADLIGPRPLTDRTIATLRERSPERTIVHYMQPHSPLRSDVERGLVSDSMSPWQQVNLGIRSREEVWEAYKDNLRWVLDDLEVLLENVDADRVVITSDHGNALGEWGCYGHRPRVPVDAVKEVPWIETTATDEGTYSPELEPTEGDVTDEDLQDRLEALGYA